MQIKQCDRSEFILNENQIEKIDKFIELVKKWNGLSLIAKSTVTDIWKWHILEALSIQCLLDKNTQIIDFGAGGGVIGIPLIHIGYNVLLVERSETKGFFLNDIAKVPNYIGPNFSMNESFCAIVRGVSKIDVVLKLLGSNASKVIFLKSHSYKEEIKKAKFKYNFDLKVFPRCYVSGKVVVLSNIRRK